MEGRTAGAALEGQIFPGLAISLSQHIYSNYTAKLYHQCIRTHLVDTWERSLKVQISGQAWTKHQHWPPAVLFIDIRSAFYTVLRQAFTQLPTDNAAFRTAMTTLGVTPEEIHNSWRLPVLTMPLGHCTINTFSMI